MQRLYQIVSGKGIVKHEETCYGTVEKGEIFGDISFLFGSTATANVIAASETEVYVIEAEYLKRLFTNSEFLGGKFFKYLSINLQIRIDKKLSRFISEATINS